MAIPFHPIVLGWVHVHFPLSLSLIAQRHPESSPSLQEFSNQPASVAMASE